MSRFVLQSPLLSSLFNFEWLQCVNEIFYAGVAGVALSNSPRKVFWVGRVNLRIVDGVVQKA